MKYKILIEGSDGKVFEPIVLNDIRWETERMGAPSRLSFTVVKDQTISFSEGSKVQLSVNGKDVFLGFIFQKKRDKEHHIECVAYDQTRYLKNKDCYVYVNKTASELLRMIANDFRLTCGTIENTGYKIPKYAKSDQTLFDIILDALDLTLDNTKKLYVLYDDFGKLTLKNIESMKVPLLIDNDTAENFDYSSSIDSDTYNRIKLVKTEGEKGKLEVYEARDNNNIGNWGYLQYYKEIQDGVNGASMADALLKLKNRKTRSLTVKGAFGDLRVRAGCSLPVHLNLGDIVTQNYLVCNKVTHYFTAEHHSMDIELYDANTFTGG